MTRRLALRREVLAELRPADLGRVVGGITAPNCWGPTTLIPNRVLPEPAHTFNCPPSGMC